MAELEVDMVTLFSRWPSCPSAPLGSFFLRPLSRFTRFARPFLVPGFAWVFAPLFTLAVDGSDVAAGLVAASFAGETLIDGVGAADRTEEACSDAIA